METFLDSHSREKFVYKGKCASTLIKGKHDTWLARGLMTYKYDFMEMLVENPILTGSNVGVMELYVINK